MNNPPTKPETPDYYDMLGLSEHASDQEILKAFKHLKREYHPDSKLSGSEPSEGKFK
jgi:molecular chaperone DnaJ